MKYINNGIKIIRENLTNRFILLGLFLLLFVILSKFFTGSLLPSTDVKDLWFYSGIFMVLFSLLFIEPYYSSPKNVITNTIPLLLLFLSIRNSFENKTFWIFAITIILLLLVTSIVVLSLQDKEKSPDALKNKIADELTKWVVFFGQGKILYSSVFIYFLLTYHSIQSVYILILFILWATILLIDPKKIKSTFNFKKRHLNENAIGEIFGVQSKKIFLVKLFEDRKSIKKFDPVKFRYSMSDEKDLIITGIVFDTYLLNQEKWAKILQLADPVRGDIALEKNVVYKISDAAQTRAINGSLKVESFVGVIIEGSSIGKIKFEYSKKKDDLQEGDLLELMVGDKRLFYQVITGTTEKEKLEARNEMSFIEGEAIQLGEWDNTEVSFQKFGWVPAINTPIFKADTSNIQVAQYTYPNYKLGVIPGTNLPSIIDLNEAVSHHMALLGVTGSGKSYIAREIIKELVHDTKVICVDFNKEFTNSFATVPPNIISDAKAVQISANIDWINNELEKFPNQQDKVTIAAKEATIKSVIKEEIEAFIDDANNNITVFELPDVNNTNGILDYTKHFFKVLFEVAKERQIAGNAAKISVVLEEAHTIIPEWNFAASNDKTSQGLVNCIGQIALQGRKYGIGFLVIAQRTANVSKTILTQCNTVICFQAFDETSISFLGNYVGKEMVQVLPNLKRYHAIVAGKAVKANLPMIIDLKR